jgi:hypothetical protein
MRSVVPLIPFDAPESLPPHDDNPITAAPAEAAAAPWIKRRRETPDGASTTLLIDSWISDIFPPDWI